MPAPIPFNRWSWKYEKCLRCETTSKLGRSKHEAKGLCMFCYKREENEKKPKKRAVRWYKNHWQKIKDDPIKVQKYYEQLKRLKTGSDWYKYHLKTRWARTKYKKFIKEWFENREICFKNLKPGIIFNLEFGNKEYRITTPLQDKHLKNHHLIVFRKEFERYMKKHS